MISSEYLRKQVQFESLLSMVCMFELAEVFEYIMFRYRPRGAEFLFQNICSHPTKGRISKLIEILQSVLKGPVFDRKLSCLTQHIMLSCTKHSISPNHKPSPVLFYV